MEMNDATLALNLLALTQFGEATYCLPCNAEVDTDFVDRLYAILTEKHPDGFSPQDLANAINHAYLEQADD